MVVPRFAKGPRRQVEKAFDRSDGLEHSFPVPEIGCMLRQHRLWHLRIENTVGNQKWRVGGHKDHFDPSLSYREVNCSLTDDCAIISESKADGARRFFHGSFDMSGQHLTQFFELRFSDD